MNIEFVFYYFSRRSHDVHMRLMESVPFEDDISDKFVDVGFREK
jgi:hypothetical protein